MKAFIPYTTNPHATMWEAWISLDETRVLRLFFSGEGNLMGSPSTIERSLRPLTMDQALKARSKEIDIPEEHVKKFLALEQAFSDAHEATSFLGNYLP